MKTTELIGLKNVSKVTEGLKQLLADFQLHYTNLRGYHWNIVGKDFYVLHKQFEEMYDDIAEKVDEVAERLLMLGETPEQRFSEYLKIAKIKETGVVSNGEEAMKSVLEAYKYFIKCERQILADASEVDDEVTVALMGDYLSEQEKAVWMLSAYLA